MPRTCIISSCTNSSVKRRNITYYQIPHEKKTSMGKECDALRERREKWMLALKKTDLNETKWNNARICSRHFISGKPAEKYDITHPDWIPTQNMGRLGTGEEMPRPHGNTPKRLQIDQLRILDKHLFENDDVRTQFFTGFPQFVQLNSIYKMIEPHLTTKWNLSKFQQLLMTVMKLRLNSPIGYRFGIDELLVSQVFNRILDLLHSKFAYLVFWPLEEEYLQKNIPKSLENAFGIRTIIIVDCFDVVIQKSMDFQPPHYNDKCEIIKFLIGISSGAHIMFLSNAFNSEDSDEYIIKESGFLKHLKFGDLVLAKEDFLIDEAVSCCGAETQYLPLRNRHNAEVDSVQVQVERIIESVKDKFSIFNSRLLVLKQRTLSERVIQAEKTVAVCCALLNFLNK